MNEVQFKASKILYDGDLEAAAELKAAGWEAEKSAEWLPVYSWKWRRPGRRPGKPGRLFQSPTVALKALRQERKAARLACERSGHDLCQGPHAPCATQVCRRCGAWRIHPMVWGDSSPPWELERDVRVEAKLRRKP